MTCLEIQGQHYEWTQGDSWTDEEKKAGGYREEMRGDRDWDTIAALLPGSNEKTVLRANGERMDHCSMVGKEMALSVKASTLVPDPPTL
jgi:hypothetical protein